MKTKQSNNSGKSQKGTLDYAVKKAVLDSLAVVNMLQTRVDKALTTIGSVAKHSRNAVDGNINATQLVDLFQEELNKSRNEAGDLFERQRKVLGTVNIALFGRTGTGKSSLIEALIHGDGSTVSTSESDFTTEIRPVSWGGCQFIDTPGTNGWGRGESREILEGRARKAVEVADVVVLCFDTQSQQKGEFEKIGIWVKEYGKPVVAVLNVRNPLWRRPANVPFGSQRCRLSQAVREHATNIDTELAAIGIFSAPVIAINAQRAVYAQVKGQYKGPAVKQFKKLRKEFGPEDLLKGSNFTVFKNIIVEALENHASELRLGMLYAQVSSILKRLERTLDKAALDAKNAAVILDRTIEGLFAVVGYPPQGSEARNALPKDHRHEDILSRVENVRGGSYEAKVQGKLVRFAKQRLTAEIGSLRAQSLSNTEEAIAQAFESRRNLSSQELSQKVFQPDMVRTACERVAVEIEKFLERETKLVIADTRLDIEFVFGEGLIISGAEGKTRRTIGNAMKIGGVFSGGLSTVLMGLALVDFEPITKTILIASSVLAGLASLILGWFGGKQLKEAEESRQRAWAEAIASTRRQVNEIYDGFAKQASDTAASMALKAMVQLLVNPLTQVGGLWTLAAESTSAMSTISRLRDELPANTDTQMVLKEASKIITNRLYNGNTSGAMLALLGESWINDPVGLMADEGRSELERTVAYDPNIFRRLFEGFRDFTHRFGNNIEPGAGIKWFEETHGILSGDSDAVVALNELKAINDKGMARFLLIGDYSSGKTSFVKRLLIDAGLPLPETLEIRADPTTDHIYLYEWEQILLVDTPGLQSTKEIHDNIAIEAYPDASAVLYLLQPNLLVGSTSFIEKLLKGDRSLGIAPKLDRTIFVIHRSDELGTDPEIVPDEYMRLCERKKKELLLALASKGIQVKEDQVFCMSADPYQLVGNRRDVNSVQFDRFRAWDGFADFHKAIREINSRFKRTGVERSLLEGGLARLGKIDAFLTIELQKLKFQKEAVDRINVVLTEILAESERINAELRAKAKGMVDDHAYGSLERVAGAADDVELESTAKHLAKWWDLPSFMTDAERWQSEAKTTIDEWFNHSTEILKRTLNSPHFKAAIANAKGGFNPKSLEGPGQGWLNGVLKITAQPLKTATRGVVYFVGKALGASFRPWGAVNLARILGRVGVVLSAVTTVFDAINMYRGWKAEKRRAEVRKELRGFIEETAAQVLQSLTDGNAEAAGPMTYLKAIQDHMSGIASALSLDRQTLEKEIGDINDRRARYSNCMTRAWESLGYKEDIK